MKQALEQAPWDRGFEQWAKSLRAKNIEPVPIGTQEDPGKLRGMTFDYQNETFKGSSVGKSYSWKHIEERLGGYEKNRDLMAFKIIDVPGKGRLIPERKQEPPQEAQKVEKGHNVTRQNQDTKAPEKPEAKLIRDRVLDINKHPVLKHFTKGVQPFELKYENKKIMKVEDVIKDRQARGQDWSLQARQPGEQLGTLMERDIRTKEGRYSLVVTAESKALENG